MQPTNSALISFVWRLITLNWGSRFFASASARAGYVDNSEEEADDSPALAAAWTAGGEAGVADRSGKASSSAA